MYALITINPAQSIISHTTTDHTFSFQADFVPENQLIEQAENDLYWSDTEDRYLWSWQSQEVEIRNSRGRLTQDHVSEEFEPSDYDLETCSDCGCLQHSDHITSDSHRTLCSDCIGNYSSCEQCGDILDEYEQHWNEHDNSVYCSDCYPDYSGDANARRTGFYQPTLHDRYLDDCSHKRPSAYPIPLGIEIEGELHPDHNDRREALTNLITTMTTTAHWQWRQEGISYSEGRSIATSKSDGSLTTNAGFELEFSYNRLETYRAIFRDKTVKSLYNSLFDDDKHDNDSEIGLHISIPQSYLASRKALYFASLIMEHYENEPDDAEDDFGRCQNHYNDIKPAKWQAKHKTLRVKYNALAIHSIGNPEVKTKTERYGRIEFRLPKSATSAQTLLDRLELAMSLFMFARYASDVLPITTKPETAYNAFKAFHRLRLDLEYKAAKKAENRPSPK
jgi:hypothetical protein